ncbi:unnamed protein product [Aspergillus oryzae]|nr:unnamed protein product [Aspergillus oryzae]GMF85043.1 unnamed protein product [Aspergillus oryzae]
MAMGLDDPSSPKTLNAAAAPETVAPEPPKPAFPPAPAAPAVPPQIEDFDTLINKDVRNFVDLGNKIGDLVAEQVRLSNRTSLHCGCDSLLTGFPEPQPAELMTELHTASDSINMIRESNRASPLFNHLSAVAEVQGKVRPLLSYSSAKQSTYVLIRDKTHVQYIQSYYQIFKALAAYLKKHYPKGLTWNEQSGIDALEALRQVKGGSSTGASGSAPPPPPPPPVPTLNVPGGAPPPPPPPPGVPPPPSAAPGGDMSAVFAQLNQGEAITSGLRKVDKSEMTHKNPSLRASSTVPERPDSQGSISRSKSPAPSKKPKPESMRVRKPPRKDLESNKWYIENFDNPGEIVEIPAQQNQSILISRCNKTIVKVSSKANAIAIDNCKDLSIIVDSLVSSLDVIKCTKFALQIDGVAPTLLLDQVDGATVYLGPQSLNTEVFSSKCTALNIMLPPKEGTDEDTKECPVPEQIKSYVKDGVLVNEIVEHAG